jgi:GNAT superfamily N-acetyltransferase
MSLVAREIGSDYDRVLQFFEELLRSDSSCRLSDEYPLVFQPDDLGLIIIDGDVEAADFLKQAQSQHRSYICIVEEAGVIKAGLALLKREIEVKEGETASFFFVGSVVTSPEFRNLGLQRELFSITEKLAEHLSIDFIMLWSNQVEFYQKLGFELGGLQATWTYPFKSQLSSSGQDVQFGNTQTIEFRSEYSRAFSEKRFRVGRTEDEMARLWKIPQMQAAVTSEAYALVGKGEDFHGICHEWAGPSDQVLACLQRLRDEYNDLRILSPGVLHLDNEREVTRQLEAQSFEPRLEYLGLIKIMSSRFALGDLNPQQLRLPFFIWGLDSI